MPGRRLTARERKVIADGLAAGDSYATVARRLGRPTSTVSREVGRAGGTAAYVAASRPSGSVTPPTRRGPAGAATERDALASDAIRTLSAPFHDSGLPRTASAVLASLIIAEAPVSAAQLSRRLGVTHGTVSRAVGYLERLSVLHRESVGRQDRYSLEPRVWSRVLELNAQRNTRWLAAARRCLGIAEIGPVGRERLTAMTDFLRRLGADMNAAAANADDPVGDDLAVLLAALVRHRAPLPGSRLLASLAWPARRLEAVLAWLEENPDALFPLTVRVTGAGLVADAHPEALPGR
ncbi:GbsR/MarR family transcriptional regulator [Planomonospora sp. ID82291]|uniref:GbsR/MarR family transcriptional regulator n=1 Tax=Planomonospora sp. ID82291 TaxID=2738136 RepID=UPI0018C406A2|nr:helix-turn-helix domain-containing protein [Planomonospora sp. ID82291]MBG0817917.1 helix-turn-helix domain-containing protein [Planomonospora sp. ID82291]